MIKLEKLNKSFGSVKAVSDVSFEIAERETVVLLGTSGCGKTTLLKMINRLIEPTSGNIFLNGENIWSKKPEELRRNIGYVLQNNGLFPHYTIEENIAVVPRLLKWDNKKIEERTLSLLEKLHLDKRYLKVYPAELSGGQQQRVGLARALIADPPVLLMDEPFGALDTITRTKIQAEFKNLDELKRKTVIIVTHDVQEAFELGDRVCLMDKGSIKQIGAPADLLFNPTDKFASDFLKDQNLLLQLKAVRITQIAPLPALGGYNLGSLKLDPDTSVWQVLELFKLQGVDLLTINNNELTSTMRLGQLMDAFYEHVKTSRHE